jgi:hypothetical protein
MDLNHDERIWNALAGSYSRRAALRGPGGAGGAAACGSAALGRTGAADDRAAAGCEGDDDTARPSWSRLAQEAEQRRGSPLTRRQYAWWSAFDSDTRLAGAAPSLAPCAPDRGRGPPV